ncbi:MAG: hypothetical protein WA633_13235, partial [Stellaceae bacterium]
LTHGVYAVRSRHLAQLRQQGRSRRVGRGDPKLLKRYDVILLDPQKHPQAKQQPARHFADWLASPEGQAAIGAYRGDGEQPFHPSAAAPK